MWARIVEILLGLWLLASPFVFGVAEPAVYLVFGVATMGFGLLSFWSQTRWMHLVTLLIAFALAVVGFASAHPVTASAQNQIIVAALLGMFAIIPNHTNDPPPSWEKFYEDSRN